MMFDVELNRCFGDMCYTYTAHCALRETYGNINITEREKWEERAPSTAVRLLYGLCIFLPKQSRKRACDSHTHLFLFFHVRLSFPCFRFVVTLLSHYVTPNRYHIQTRDPIGLTTPDTTQHSNNTPAQLFWAGVS